MNYLLRLTVIGLACAFAPVCFGQWMWIDKSGRKVLSDQMPPSDVPADKILKRPGNRPAEPESAAADAKRAKATIDSGVRLTQVNSKGEREFLDDSQRAAEAKRLDAIIAQECKAN
jgi:hypothetical protein